VIDNYEEVQAVFAERFSEVEDMIAKKHHITLGDIAEKIGVNPTTAYAWRRRGRSLPRTGELRNICLKFGVSADYLLGLSNCKGIRR
jgi:transcriptional regulator with XRE-family HTH domain